MFPHQSWFSLLYLFEVAKTSGKSFIKVFFSDRFFSLSARKKGSAQHYHDSNIYPALFSLPAFFSMIICQDNGNCHGNSFSLVDDGLCRKPLEGQRWLPDTEDRSVLFLYTDLTHLGGTPRQRLLAA